MRRPQPYQILFVASSNEALAKLPPPVEQVARLKLQQLAADEAEGTGIDDLRPLRLFEIPPYAFAYVVDRELRSVILERVYMVIRADSPEAKSWERLVEDDEERPVRH